ncbi:MAG: CDGSH iron-sulfur domain-containing protein [Paracoccaceae bacterium]
MTKKPVIETRENGPLLIKGARSVAGPDGEAVEVKEVMALCRCGASANKPFCDGSHNKIGFESSGGTPAGKDRLYAYEGEAVAVLYNPLICSHAAECVRLQPKAFDPKARPWIQPDNTNVEGLEAVVRACPSGALQIARSGEAAAHLQAERADVVIQKDGPYWVSGCEIAEPGPGEGGSKDKFVLCRCGLSGNKPYCDGTHRDKGWSDD